MIEIIHPSLRIPFSSVTLASGRRCFAAEAGQEYAIRVRVETGIEAAFCGLDRRVEAVISVDGRDVVTNEDASPERSGYLLDVELIVEGFRVSGTAVRRFVITEFGFGRTTAERNGTTAAVGLIACAIHTGARPNGGSMLRSASRSSERVTRGGVGTGAGAEVNSPVEQVEFRRSGQAPTIEVIEYDTYDGWAQRGVMIPRISLANPWPGHRTGFADPNRL